MNTKNYDHYFEAHALADLLQNEGLQRFSTEIRRAILEGATGTEIFMSLRWEIGMIINSNQCSPEAEELAKTLYTELSASLNLDN